MFKLIFDFFGILFLLFLLLSPLFLMLAVFLIWKGSGTIRVLGWLLLFLLAYYKLSWISPWYVTKGSELVQEYKFKDILFRISQTYCVRWLEASHRLLILPSDELLTNPKSPFYTHLLAIDIETRKTHWLRISEVNLDTTEAIESLPTESPRLGTQFEYSYVGFSLPILFYNIPWIFSETTGWRWEKTDFGWWRYLVKDSKLDSSVLELSQIVFGSRQNVSGAISGWVIEGKFLIFEPYIYSDPRILVLGPFGISQSTQSQPINKNK